MKVYAVVHGEKHQGGEVERLFPSYTKALDYTTPSQGEQHCATALNDNSHGYTLSKGNHDVY